MYNTTSTTKPRPSALTIIRHILREKRNDAAFEQFAWAVCGGGGADKKAQNAYYDALDKGADHLTAMAVSEQARAAYGLRDKLYDHLCEHSRLFWVLYQSVYGGSRLGKLLCKVWGHPWIMEPEDAPRICARCYQELE